MSCLWLLLSSVLHLVVVPPNVVLFVAMIEVAWDSVISFYKLVCIKVNILSIYRHGAKNTLVILVSLLA
jgi:hypothetical protein